ncbi:hypothetical protein L1787_19705 [Acuticoccus sp. M5D2P5]|uniref:hypothetical protein n=1 Tax=Acuticoccus kalidii TaxID=2910977 RepID=UPI001F315B83|nr:hypothetical protein [Acuticoccus kalidii]MCF3935623.1 hypothetical protein [Acuticoccus kalidii]
MGLVQRISRTRGLFLGGTIATLMASAVSAQTVVVAPVDAMPGDTERYFVDGRIVDLRVDQTATVAVLDQVAMSGCPSNNYVFPRDQAKWLYQTGRLMVAEQQGATIRLSVSCEDGEQNINALQFLTPPPASDSVRRMPSRSSVAAYQPTTRRAASRPLDGSFPVPSGDRNAVSDPMRIVPLP